MAQTRLADEYDAARAVTLSWKRARLLASRHWPTMCRVAVCGVK